MYHMTTIGFSLEFYLCVRFVKLEVVVYLPLTSEIVYSDSYYSRFTHESKWM